MLDIACGYKKEPLFHMSAFPEQRHVFVRPRGLTETQKIGIINTLGRNIYQLHDIV
jgi:hypothetical protein